MLVISRHADERTIIELEDGRRIGVVVTSIRGDKVRIGFEAPASIVIHREEIMDRVDRERVRR